MTVDSKTDQAASIDFHDSAKELTQKVEDRAKKLATDLETGSQANADEPKQVGEKAKQVIDSGVEKVKNATHNSTEKVKQAIGDRTVDVLDKTKELLVKAEIKVEEAIDSVKESLAK